MTETAKLAKEGGCEEFHLVSSSGCNEECLTPFLKMKYQAEEKIKNLNFKKTVIYQPGYLIHKRRDNVAKEKILWKLFKPAFYLSPLKFSIPTETLGKAVMNRAKENSTISLQYISNEGMHKLYKEEEEEERKRKSSLSCQEDCKRQKWEGSENE